MRSGRIFAALFVTGLLALGVTNAPGSGVYGFEAERIDGTQESLSTYRGRVLLVVNVASRCGFTPQYEGLQALFDRYRERGLVVLGFPSNDFRGQEPGSDAEIAEFCKMNYGVEFPMFSKIQVLGDDRHPLYAYLTGRPEPIGGDVEWNFQKYLIDRDGQAVAKFSPKTKPDDAALMARLETLLDAAP